LHFLALLIAQRPRKFHAGKIRQDDFGDNYGWLQVLASTTTLPAFKRPKCAFARLARVWLKAKAHPFALLFLTSAKSINAHFLLRVSCAFESG
jgi:hypothetical protein